MTKTILWDFDGVILDSMKIKGDGFVELFKAYNNVCLIQMERYHYSHGGVSRFEKIKYFYKEILDKPISEDTVTQLADEFSNIIDKKLNNKKNLIKETVDFIKHNYQKYNFHIVSGAEHNELNKLCDSFELIKYFKSIDGSPIKKDLLVKNVIKKFDYKKNEVVLIGDAITDYNASKKNGIKFYGFNNLELKKLDGYIDSFEGLKF